MARNKETGSIFLGANWLLPMLPAQLCVSVNPLTNLTRKSEPEMVSWSEDCSKVLSELKEMLLSYPVRSVNFSFPFTLQVDASNIGVKYL